jgi:hypothetical protein
MGSQELLECIGSILADDRLEVGTALLKDDAELIVATKILVKCDDLILEGEPAMLSWPLQQLPIPEAFKKENPERFN